MDELIHVRPVNEAHAKNVRCKCQPTIEGNLVVHNTFNGREIAEEIPEYRRGARQLAGEERTAHLPMLNGDEQFDGH